MSHIKNHKSKMAQSFTVSQSNSSGSKRNGKWTPLKKLEPITVDQATEFGGNKYCNQYEHMVALLEKLGSRASFAQVLRQTSGTITKLVECMKLELPKHKEALTGEKPVENAISVGSRDLEQVLEEIEAEADESQEQIMRKSGVALDKEVVIRKFPLLESTIYKLVRRLDLIATQADETPESNLMISLAAVELLPLIVQDLKAIVSPLEEIEFWNSRYEANIGDKVVLQDKKSIVEIILRELVEIRDMGKADELGIGDAVIDIIDGIEQAQEEAKMSDEIIDIIKEKLVTIVDPLADFVDHAIADIKPNQLITGQLEFRDEFGDASKGTCQWNGKLKTVLSKDVSFRNDLGAMARRELQTELDRLRRLSHINLTDFIGTCSIRKTDHLYLVWDYCECNLDSALFNEETKEVLQRRDFVLTNKVLMNFACDMLVGLAFLHNNGVIHQALTTKNVFIRNDLSGVCLGDFCFVDGKKAARKKLKAEETEETDIVPYGMTYRAPETLTRANVQRKPVVVYASDMYSFAIVFFEMLESRKAFEGMKTEVFMKKLFAKVPRRPNFSVAVAESTPNFVKDVIQRCWQQKPELRPTATGALEELRFQMAEAAAEGEEEQNEEEDDNGMTKKQKRESVEKWLEKEIDPYDD